MKEKKSLTKAEEQIMQALWQVEKGFLKDVLEALPAPQPHSNTVATLLKIMVEKGFVKTETIGRNHLYVPTISREQYSRQSLGSVVSKYFEGDYRNAVSFLVDQKQLSISDLEILLNELKKRS